MRILVTGAAGFIGLHTCLALLDAGHEVIGVDNLNSYYPPALKRERLRQLERPSFTFRLCDIADHSDFVQKAGLDIDVVIHLAAQAGVRHSIDRPFDYERANLAGHLSVLEYCRKLPSLQRLVYASSSSVYGERSDAPFRESDRCDRPASLYAATKRSCEMMSEAYAALYGIDQIGVRFFTVYGEFGRPDMAYWMFTDSICAGRPITLFNGGRMERDFTYIGDVAPTLAKMAEEPPPSKARHEIFNLGNNSPTQLTRFVAAIEAAAGQKADIRQGEMQAGDVSMTYADISKARNTYGFDPKTTIEVGLARFVAWFKQEDRTALRYIPATRAVNEANRKDT